MAINKTLLAVSRTVHIYLTMLGLLVMLLFSVTGFTLNHEEWFNASTPRIRELEGQVPLPLIARNDDLRIVEHLRQAFSIRGALENFADFEEEYAVSFKAPGEIWEIAIAKTTGRAAARQEQYNFTALINNLHRGRYTGPAWRWVIDLSAAVVVLACATGVVLWLALPKRRQLGIAFLLAGMVGTMAVVYFLVPGPDAARPPPRRAATPAPETTAR